MQIQKLKPDKCGIGDNLKRIRRQKGYTQMQVVARMEIKGFHFPREKYIKMENNNYNIRINELVALKELFETSFDELFRGIESTPDFWL